MPCASSPGPVVCRELGLRRYVKAGFKRRRTVASLAHELAERQVGFPDMLAPTTAIWSRVSRPTKVQAAMNIARARHLK